MKTAIQTLKTAARLFTLAEIAAMPLTKADSALEAAEFKATCARAKSKGNRARELIDAPECAADPELVANWSKDYNVKGKQ